VSRPDPWRPRSRWHFSLHSSLTHHASPMTTSVVKPALKLWVALYRRTSLVLRPPPVREMNVNRQSIRSAFAWLRSIDMASRNFTPSAGPTS